MKKEITLKRFIEKSYPLDGYIKTYVSFNAPGKSHIMRKVYDDIKHILDNIENVKVFDYNYFKENNIEYSIAESCKEKISILENHLKNESSNGTIIILPLAKVVIDYADDRFYERIRLDLIVFKNGIQDSIIEYGIENNLIQVYPNTFQCIEIDRVEKGAENIDTVKKLLNIK